MTPFGPLFSRRTLLTAALTAPLAATLSACSRTAEAYHAQILVFGTQVDIQLYHPQQTQINQAIGKINRDFQQFHHEWHAWEKGGILSRINQAIAQQQPIEVADSVRDFILKSQRLCQQSDGLFDPGIGYLIALWGFHGEQWQGPPPSAAAIHSWLQSRPSIQDLYFQGNQLLSHNPQVQLDFGGNAKGLALDMALDSLRQAGIEQALVSIGGDMKALGAKSENQPWRVAISDPQHPSQARAALALGDNESVVTSGTYQRFFEWQGQRFSHILNPNTGYPANGFASVTVIHPDATTADAAATALLIAGPERWQKIAQQMGIEQVFCLDYDNQIAQTKAMEKRVKLI
ncbi:MAG: FAD:protein FMN transferase [Thiotrichales bacterium]|nr:FAD:protein FMN transferase [Thiotrichales bacterium]